MRYGGSKRGTRTIAVVIAAVVIALTPLIRFSGADVVVLGLVALSVLLAGVAVRRLT